MQDGCNGPPQPALLGGGKRGASSPGKGGAVPLLLDIGPAVHQGAGLARYAEQLALHLRRLPEEVDLELFYNAHSGHGLPAGLQGVPVRSLSRGQVAWRLSVLASQLFRRPLRSLAAVGTRPRLYHATEHLLPYLRTPAVLTVHDLIFERYPEHHTRRNVWFLKVGMRLFTRAAAAIVAVSQHTRRDLIALYKTPPDKIWVIHEGIDPLFQPASAVEVARVRAHYRLESPYLLMVGTLEPRKNHRTALHALAQLRAQGAPHQLVIAGGKGWLFEPIRQQVDELGLADAVVFTGYVPAADLPALYTAAECLLLPSLYEGFGFPALEAMACATPVICSNAGSLPEIVGAAALQVSPLESAELAGAIRQVVSQPELSAQLRRLGREQAAAFSWERCAAQTAALYRQLEGAG
ncbi:MAG: glycosyltransferase family 4 protein [Caldilinea sp.]|jgi:glycosyltransferase involved in cell wall biosynthesis